MNTLYLFDMDETLIAHDPWHREVYIRQNGHNMDESTGFSTVYRSTELFVKGTPIVGMINLLRLLDKYHYPFVMIVTARDAVDDRRRFDEFMCSINIDVPVKFAGANKTHDPARNKFIEISKILEIEHDYIEHVHLFDDSKDNIEMLEMLKAKFPHITFYGHHFNMF